MANLADHHSSSIVKAIYMGDSGTGKTGSLTSLVKAGYKLRIIDLDNGLDPLVTYIRKECPDKITNVEFESVRDTYKPSPLGPIISGAPKAFTTVINLLTKWTDGTSPSEWGPDTVIVIDSLSAVGAAALAWAEGMNPTAKDKRNWFFTAQQALEKMLDMLTSKAFKCNVIVITHVQMKELEDGTTKGYANAVGSALGPIIPRYFNTMIQAKTQGSGTNLRRTISTIPSAQIDLKNPAPFRIDKELPLESGLATLFAKLKETA